MSFSIITKQLQRSSFQRLHPLSYEGVVFTRYIHFLRRSSFYRLHPPLLPPPHTSQSVQSRNASYFIRQLRGEEANERSRTQGGTTSSTWKQSNWNHKYSPKSSTVYLKVREHLKLKIINNTQRERGTTGTNGCKCERKKKDMSKLCLFFVHIWLLFNFYYLKIILFNRRLFQILCRFDVLEGSSPVINVEATSLRWRLQCGSQLFGDKIGEMFQWLSVSFWNFGRFFAGSSRRSHVA